MNGIQHSPGWRRSILSGETKSGLPQAKHGFVEIGGIIDNQRIFAAHFADHGLDEWLIRRRIGGGAEDFHSDLL